MPTGPTKSQLFEISSILFVISDFSRLKGNMIIYVHIEDKVFAVNCGDGSQSIRWLGNVAVSRIDESNYGLHTGVCMGMRLENK